jgi:hypothetical protein
MTRSTLLKSALCALMVPLLSCNLIDVTGDEDARSGRGAKLHDPYQSLASGALRLSLQYFNGCAVLPTGQMVAKNSTQIPYPDVCATLLSPLLPPSVKTPPTGQLKLVTNTPYFLNQFSVTDAVENLHTNPRDLSDALRWIRTASWMKKLDWSNVGASPDEWSFVAGFAGILQDAWTREVHFTNARWETVKDDTFTVEVLDRDGTSRTTVVYKRSELLAGTSYAGHSRVSWRMENSQPPLFPGDLEPRPLTVRTGNLPQPITYRTIARMDVVGSTNPFKTFTTPSQPGDGALKITWSQMPDDPFYFPVTFVAREELPATCSNEQGEARPCGFGIDPQLAMAPPAQGSFYKPGETLKLIVDIRDIDGNRLHSPKYLPSAADITSDKANGLLALVNNLFANTLEADNNPIVAVAGPLHKMRVQSNPREAKEFFAVDPYLVDQASGTHLVPSIFTAPWPATQSITLPMDAEKGTYVAFVKASRYFMGERVSKMQPFFFQVGADEETTYPAQVGNCQICHRGVLSLDNLRHGLSVDNIEGCKACHQSDNDLTQRTQEVIHKIHMNSPRFTVAKNDCTICHLTKESATRPSITACASCHPSQHGDKYFQVAFTNSGEPSRFGNCAQSCHGDQTPKSHILPAN